MPGVRRFAVGEVVNEAARLVDLGIPAVLLFGLPAEKGSQAPQAMHPESVVCQAVRQLRRSGLDLAIICDVCLCEYTDHGHCGIVNDGRIDNDATLPLLAETARAYADAGADLVAPSGMMDGMVAAIRARFDARGHHEVGILSYSVKYASAFYGPFREAAACAPQFGDRRTHQMDPANAREALAEAEADLAEGADALMVKPALPYLDVLARLRERWPAARLAAYQVSGEYSMLQAAVKEGWLPLEATVLETLTAIKRAGADMIITYFAAQAAGWLR
jgi:porphobilinogen synthase